MKQKLLVCRTDKKNNKFAHRLDRKRSSHFASACGGKTRLFLLSPLFFSGPPQELTPGFAPTALATLRLGSQTVAHFARSQCASSFAFASLSIHKVLDPRLLLDVRMLTAFRHTCSATFPTLLPRHPCRWLGRWRASTRPPAVVSNRLSPTFVVSMKVRSSPFSPFRSVNSSAPHRCFWHVSFVEPGLKQPQGVTSRCFPSRQFSPTRGCPP